MESAGLEIRHLKPEDAQYQKPKPWPKNSLLSHRRIEDASCWSVTLNPSKIRATPSYPDYLLENASFDVTTHNCVIGKIDANCFDHYVIKAWPVHALSLSHLYVLSYRVAFQLNIFFRDLTIVSLYRLPKSQQPQHLAQIFTNQHCILPDMTAIAVFTPPKSSTWKYYDEEMMRYLKDQYPKLEKELQGIGR
jgi:hypothetical protein